MLNIIIYILFAYGLSNMMVFGMGPYDILDKFRNLFKKLCKERGVGYARIHFFLISSITAVENEYIPVEDENGNY